MRKINSDRKILVRKEALLETLQTNLHNHITDYTDAVDGYKEEAKTRLGVAKSKAEDKLKQAYARTLHEIENFDPETASDVVVFCESIRFDLVAPKNFSEAYQQAIEMFKWEERDEIELTSHEFRCFVMDKWDWQGEFLASNSRYLAMKKGV